MSLTHPKRTDSLTLKKIAMGRLCNLDKTTQLLRDDREIDLDFLTWGQCYHYTLLPKEND